MEKIKVLLVDDELLIREGLRIMLGTFSGIEIVGTAENGEKALEFCKGGKVDVVLMDIRMPICDGVLGTRLIKEQFKDIKVLILTTFKDSEYIKEAFKFGAYGYLLKDSASEVIYEAIKSAYNGNIVINHEMAEKIIQKEDVKNTNIDDYNLSRKEISIIDGIARGLTNKEISGELFLSEGTIKNNITNILSKLELRDRTQIAIFAFKNRIVT